MPFLFVCYVFAYVDRVNVGFAKLQMQQDLRMSDAVYGVYRLLERQVSAGASC